MDAYCFKCRAKKEIKGAQPVTLRTADRPPRVPAQSAVPSSTASAKPKALYTRGSVAVPGPSYPEVSNPPTFGPITFFGSSLRAGKSAGAP